MSKSLTNQEFIERILSFGHKLTPLTPYINKRTKIKMRCDVCGYEWECIPDHLLRGSGCPQCGRKASGEKHRLSHEEFISKIPETIEVLDLYEKYGLELHCKCKVCGYEWANKAEYLLKNKYCPNCANTIRYTNESFKEYAEKKSPNIIVLGNYEEIGSLGNIECECRVCHHKWRPNVNALKRGQNCPKCAAKATAEINSKTLEQFIYDAKKVHGDKYDYSKVVYQNNKTKVTIICPEHGEFEQTPAAHLAGEGCPKCAHEQRGLLSRRSNEDFIKVASAVHNNRYSYDKCQYTTKRNKVIITCPVHGDFEQLAGNHICGCGCPKCNSSKGEQLIIQLLDKYLLKYIYLYLIKHLINNRKVIVDFILKHNDKDYVIEYNGMQHYQPIDYFGGEKVFKLQLIRDLGLRDLCNQYNIHLIEIPYWTTDTEIEEIIKNNFI